MMTGTEPARHRSTKASYAARVKTWVPYILALFFGLSALKGVTTTDVIDTDAARHAMNGVFIYDMLRTHHLAHPIEYAKEYYGHLPALSMPYHPPVFPAIEALFFAVLGVKLVTARLVVALAVGLCAILLYRLIQATLASDALAACATVTTLSLGTDQLVARDVMLEFPAMVFTLAALYCLRDMDRSYPLGRAMLFAAFASAAVWTKQHTVFLGAVPFLFAIMSGRRRLLLEKPIWISSMVFAAAGAGLLFLSLQFHGTGLNQVPTTSKSALWNYSINVRTYGDWLVKNATGLPGIFALCSLALYAWTVYSKGSASKLGLHLYFSWILSYSALLLVARGSARYLFFLFPPLIVVGYALLFRGSALLWGERRAWYLPAGFAAAWFTAGILFPLEFLIGPGEVAALLVNGDPVRVLYAGQADGNFILAARSLDPGLHTTVILAQKLPVETFEPAAFERFCRRYGIDWIVLEDVPEARAWSGLRNISPGIMKLQRSFPLTSTRTRWQGKINVYRLNVPAGHSNGVLDLPVGKIGATISLKL